MIKVARSAQGTVADEARIHDSHTQVVVLQRTALYSRVGPEPEARLKARKQLQFLFQEAGEQEVLSDRRARVPSQLFAELRVLQHVNNTGSRFVHRRD